MALIFNQLFSENFQGANQNPINPAKWTTAAGFDDLQQINNRCEPSDTTNTCAANYTAISFPKDQYLQFTFSLDNGGDGVAELVLRSNADQSNCYNAPFGNNGDGTLQFYIGISVNSSFTPLYENDALPFQSSDVFKAAALGNIIYVFQNDIIIASVINSVFSSGSAGLVQGAELSVSNCQVLSFAGGGISQVPPSSPTQGTVYPGTYFGDSILTAFTNPNQLDLFQVVNEGGRVVWSIDAFGNTSFNPSFVTPCALIGKFEGSSFATAFPNPDKFDILQIKNHGGGVTFYVDYQGVSHDSPPPQAIVDGIVSYRAMEEIKGLSRFRRFR